MLRAISDDNWSPLLWGWIAAVLFICLIMLFTMLAVLHLKSEQRRANLLASSPTADTVVVSIVIVFLLIIAGYRFPLATRGLGRLVGAMLFVVMVAVSRLVARQILRRKLTRSRVDAAGRRIS